MCNPDETRSGRLDSGAGLLVELQSDTIDASSCNDLSKAVPCDQLNSKSAHNEEVEDLTCHVTTDSDVLTSDSGDNLVSPVVGHYGVDVQEHLQL